MEDYNVTERKLVVIENTRFIFQTNFAGDPNQDKFHSDQRKGNIVIPNYDQAMGLLNAGFNVKETKPREGEEEGFIPTYFVSIKLNYASQRTPKVYLTTEDGNCVLLDESTVGNIDRMWVDKVNVVLNPWDGRDKGINGKSLYVKTMEVFQRVDDDPIAARHRVGVVETADIDTGEYDDELPFH